MVVEFSGNNGARVTARSQAWVSSAPLRAVGGGRQRVVVLGTMRELGAHTARAHREVAEAALAGGIDLIGGIGEFAGTLRALAPSDARVITATDVEDLWPLLAPKLKPDAILASNTSGLSIAKMSGVLPAQLRPQFLVLHFFNPVRYMRLLEIAPGPETRPELVERMAG